MYLAFTKLLKPLHITVPQYIHAVFGPGNLLRRKSLFDGKKDYLYFPNDMLGFVLPPAPSRASSGPASQEFTPSDQFGLFGLSDLLLAHDEAVAGHLGGANSSKTHAATGGP